MLAIITLCGIRIKYTRLLVHIGGDLAGGVEEDGDLFGRCFPRLVDLVQSMYVISLVLEASDQFKGLRATTSSLAAGPSGTCTKTSRLPSITPGRLR
jgi:hypothetical protein